MRKSSAGRRQSSERIRELVSLLGSFSRMGDTVSLDTIAGRLGITTQEAAGMMDIVCQASGEDSGGLLISANDDFTEFTLQYSGIHGMPVRLTQSEAIALVHGLDVAGVADDDPIRDHVRRAYYSTDVDDQEVRRTLGSSQDALLTQTIQLCAKARATSRMIDFMYRGLADACDRSRCALIRNLRLEDNVWYVDAYDLDVLEERIFRLDRMHSVTLGPKGRLPEPDLSNSSARRVDVVFTDPMLVTLFEWPGLRITRSDNTVVEGSIPYYGMSSDWLPRRIAACAGALIVSDKDIMSLACEYAKNTLVTS